MRTKIMINESDDIKQEKTSNINSPCASPAQPESSKNASTLLQLIKDQDEKFFRFIYFLYIHGYSPQRIADGLNEVNGTGDKEWSSLTVFRIIKNEQIKNTYSIKKSRAISNSRWRF